MTRKIVSVTSPVVPIRTEAPPRKFAGRVAIKRQAHPVEPDYLIAGFRREGVDDLWIAQVFAHGYDVLNKIGNRIIASQWRIETTGSHA
jgi:hypothetical protein